MDAVEALKTFKAGNRTLIPNAMRLAKITPKLATKFKYMQKWDGERPLSESRMAYLIENIPMVHLPFLWITVIINELAYRMNGQHTSTLLSERPELIEPDMRALLVEFECESKAGASVLYASLDARNSSRTVSELNRSFSGGHPRLDRYNKGFIDLCSAGIRTSTNGIQDHGSISIVARGELLYNNLDFIDFAADILPGRTDESRHLWRVPSIYAMHKTWSVDQEDARTFWECVRDGDTERGTWPDVLRDYLRATALGGTSVRSTRVDTRAVMGEKCLRVWNAWRREYVPRKSPPKALGKIPDIV